MIWVLILGLCLGVFIYLAIPLYFRKLTPENIDAGTENEISIYRNELRRIEHLLADNDSDVDTLTAEKIILERKLIKAGTQNSNLPLDRKPIWIVSTFAVLIVGTLGIYGVIGSPELSQENSQKPVKSASTQTSIQDAKNKQHETSASMEGLISGLEKKLKAGSRDPQQWGLYARSLMATGRYEEAFSAYEEALSLTGNNPQILAELQSARAYAAQQTGARGEQPRPAPEAPGPNREDIAAAADMSAEDRNAMIQGMVDGLSLKLADNPDNPAGWVRLLRARKILGQSEAAEEELILMKAHFKDDQETISTILNQSGSQP